MALLKFDVRTQLTCRSAAGTCRRTGRPCRKQLDTRPAGLTVPRRRPGAKADDDERGLPPDQLGVERSRRDDFAGAPDET
eukprot:scaffold1410_cov386-Prasinococcus_capsulatus_cf.AAC.8